MTEPEQRLTEYILDNFSLSVSDDAFLRQLLITDPILSNGDLKMFIKIQERTVGYGNEGAIHPRNFDDV